MAEEITSISDVDIGSKISFEVYPTGYYPSSYSNCTLSAKISPDVAESLGIDIIGIHAQCYPSLPSGTPNNAHGYDWVVVKSASGEASYFGAPYIKPKSLEIVKTKKLVLIWNGLTDKNYDRVIRTLSSNGLSPDSAERG